MSSISKRDETIDIMKGILIFLVVMAHAQINETAHRFIYLFHMSVFFMISGFLWRNSQRKEFREILFRKTKSLYVPYVLCNLMYLVVFIVMPGLFDTYPLKEVTVSGVFQLVVKILLLRGRCSLTGLTWFIAVLFLSTVAYYAIWKAVELLSNNDKVQFVWVTVVVTVLFLFGYFMVSVLGSNPYQIGTSFSALYSIHIGNTIRHYNIANSINEHKRMTIVLSCLCLGLLLIWDETEIRLIDNAIVNPIYYTIAGLMGGYGIFNIENSFGGLSFSEKNIYNSWKTHFVRFVPAVFGFQISGMDTVLRFRKRYSLYFKFSSCIC